MWSKQSEHEGYNTEERGKYKVANVTTSRVNLKAYSIRLRFEHGKKISKQRSDAINKARGKQRSDTTHFTMLGKEW